MQFPCKQHLYSKIKPRERFRRAVTQIKSLVRKGKLCREWDTKSSRDFEEKYGPRDEINGKEHGTSVANSTTGDIKNQENLGTNSIQSSIPFHDSILRGDVHNVAVVPGDLSAQSPGLSADDTPTISSPNVRSLSAATTPNVSNSAVGVSEETSGRTLLVHDASFEPGLTATHRQSISTNIAPGGSSVSSDMGISTTSSQLSTETQRMQSSILPYYDRAQSADATYLHMQGGVPPDAAGSRDMGSMSNGTTRELACKNNENVEACASGGSLPCCTGLCKQSLGDESAARTALTLAGPEPDRQAGPEHLNQASHAKNLDRFSCAKGEEKAKKTEPMLPHELWIPIASFLLAMSSSILGSYMLSVSKWQDIAGLSSVSRYQRRTILRLWVSTLVLKSSNDIAFLKQLGAANQFDALSLVKNILCYDSYQIYSVRQKVLLGFSNVEELILDAHSDIHFREAIAWPDADDADDADAPAVARPRMSYKNLWVKFPSSLKVLRLFHGHCPDIAIIRKAASDCPQLEVLTLGRCTMFTQDCCQFWAHLPPEEHDAYFSNTDVEDYAEAVGKELCKLTCLEVVHIHVYLTPFAAVEEHLRHCGQEVSIGSGNLSCWQDKCPKCVEEYQAATLATEKIASGILSRHVPSIKQVSWASFFSPGRTGWSTHYVN